MSKNDVDVHEHLKNRKSKISESEDHEYSNLPSEAHPPHVLVRHFLPSSHVLMLDSTLFGRAIKNEYLCIGVRWFVFANGMARGEGWRRGGEEACDGAAG